MNKEIWYRNSIYKLSGGTMDLEERVQKLEEESETSKKTTTELKLRFFSSIKYFNFLQ